MSRHAMSDIYFSNPEQETGERTTPSLLRVTKAGILNELGYQVLIGEILAAHLLEMLHESLKSVRVVLQILQDDRLLQLTEASPAAILVVEGTMLMLAASSDHYC